MGRIGLYAIVNIINALSLPLCYIDKSLTCYIATGQADPLLQCKLNGYDC